MPVTPLVLVIYALAAARVTGLITQDDITAGIRSRTIGWLDDRPGTLGSAIATLITCSWCAGVWVSAVAAPLIWWHGSNPLLFLPAFALALAQVIGMTSQIGR